MVADIPESEDSALNSTCILSGIERRRFLRNLFGISVVSNLTPASAAMLGVVDPAPGFGHPPRKRASPVRAARESISIRDVMTATEWEAVGAGTSVNDTEIFDRAFRLANEVIVPEGIFRIRKLHLPSGRRLRGSGEKSVLRLALAPNGVAPNLIYAQNSEQIELTDIVLDGVGAATTGASFTNVARLKISRLSLTGVDGYGLVLDGCDQGSVSDVSFSRTGALGGVAALGLVDWTRRGRDNRVKGVRGDHVTGRLVALFGQDDALVEEVLHTNVFRGEAVYFFDCLRCGMDRITQLGGGSGRTGRPNPGNDGCAIDGGSQYCSASNGLIVGNSGHGLSICGYKGKIGASYNKVNNWSVQNPDEGGVVITDQGVAGSMPANNFVQNCTVVNPGERILEAAYSCFGARDNRFVDCNAEDNRTVKRMTYAFEEGFGENKTINNRWSGSVKGGTVQKVAYRLVSGISEAVPTYL